MGRVGPGSKFGGPGWAAYFRPIYMHTYCVKMHHDTQLYGFYFELLSVKWNFLFSGLYLLLYSCVYFVQTVSRQQLLQLAIDYGERFNCTFTFYRVISIKFVTCCTDLQACGQWGGPIET